MIITKKPRVYTFDCAMSSFVSNAYNALHGVDPYYDVVNQDTSWDNHNTLGFTGKDDPNLAFCISLSSNYGYHFRLGIFPPDKFGGLRPDIYTQKNQYYDMPCCCHAYNYNVSYKWTVITTPHGVFVLGQYTNYGGYAYPIRLWLGKCNPLETEDPAIADDFIGAFHHMPVNIHNDNWAYYQNYNVGRGVVRKSRNGTEHTIYNFSTDGNIKSPGVGGRYYVTPFMVYSDSEGARGEFYGVRTAVLRDGALHPDGSVMDLGTVKYLVVHVVDQAMPTQNGYGYNWYTSHGNDRHCRPYFFGSNQVYGGGQRVLLFEIEEEEVTE